MDGTVILEPTFMCNLACPMCDRSPALRKEACEMPVGVLSYREVLDRLPGLPGRVYISGGEPTLWPGLVELCGTVADRGIELSVQTNGTRPDVVRALTKAGVRHFNISVDGPEETHESIRGKGTFGKLLETVSAVSSCRGCELVTTTVLSDHNMGSVHRIFSCFRRHGIRPSVMVLELARRFDPDAVASSAALAGAEPSEVSVRVGETREFSTSLQELELVIRTLQRRARSYGRKIMFFPQDLAARTGVFHGYSFRQRARVRCSHRNILRIDPRGNVVPCFTFRKSMGNILEDPWDLIAVRSERFWDNLEKANLAPVCETCFRCTEC